MAVISLLFSFTFIWPSTNPFSRAQALMAAPEGLAINGNNLPADELSQTLRPTAKTVGKLLRIKQGKDSAEGIVTRDTIGQLKNRASPFQPGIAEILEVHETLCATQHRAKSDHENIVERMRFGPVNPGICEKGEMKSDTLGMGHKWHPEFLS